MCSSYSYPFFFNLVIGNIQESMSCPMSIWFVQVWGTLFPSLLSIVKCVRPNVAYLIISSQIWVKRRWGFQFTQSFPLSLPFLRKNKNIVLISNLQHFFFFLFFFLQAKQLAKLLDEDPAIMQRRANLGKRLELYRSAQQEIDAVAWSK